MRSLQRLFFEWRIKRRMSMSRWATRRHESRPALTFSRQCGIVLPCVCGLHPGVDRASTGAPSEAVRVTSDAAEHGGDSAPVGAIRADLQAELVADVVKHVPLSSLERNSLSPLMAHHVAKNGRNSIAFPDLTNAANNPDRSANYRAWKIERWHTPFEPPKSETAPKSILTPVLVSKLLKTNWFRTEFGSACARNLIWYLRSGKWADPVPALGGADRSDVWIVDPPYDGSCGYLAVLNALQLPIPVEVLEILSNAYIEDEQVRAVFHSRFGMRPSMLDSLGDTYEGCGANNILPRTRHGLPWASLQLLANFTRCTDRKFAYCIQKTDLKLELMVDGDGCQDGQPSDETPVGIVLYSSNNNHMSNVYPGGLPRVTVGQVLKKEFSDHLLRGLSAPSPPWPRDGCTQKASGIVDATEQTIMKCVSRFRTILARWQRW